MSNYIPENCLIKRHKTSTEGIIHILEDGCTKDSITLIKELYNKCLYKTTYNTEANKQIISVYRFHGVAQNGPRTLNGPYEDKLQLSYAVRRQLEIAPKGHYVYVDRLEWDKGIPCMPGKFVQIYYKWNIDNNYDKGSIMVRDFEDEYSPSFEDTSKNAIPEEGGEIIYPKGVDCKDFICITVPSIYKSGGKNSKWDLWSKNLETLCEKKKIKLYWIKPGKNTTDTVLEIYKKYGK